MVDQHEQMWRDIIKGSVEVPAVERLPIISRLILSSHEDVAKIATQLLSRATNMVRINTPLKEWIPGMVQAKGENPLVAGENLGRRPKSSTRQ